MGGWEQGALLGVVWRWRQCWCCWCCCCSGPGTLVVLCQDPPLGQQSCVVWPCTAATSSPWAHTHLLLSRLPDRGPPRCCKVLLAPPPPPPPPRPAELHVVDGMPSFIFVHSKYTVQTSEAERIGVDQVAKILPTGAASGSNQRECSGTPWQDALAGAGGCLPRASYVPSLLHCAPECALKPQARGGGAVFVRQGCAATPPWRGAGGQLSSPAESPHVKYVFCGAATTSLLTYLLPPPPTSLLLPPPPPCSLPAVSAHLTSLHSAVKMLVSRVAILHKLLLAMEAGAVPLDHALVRQAAGLISRLPAIDAPQFRESYLTVRGSGAVVVMWCRLVPHGEGRRGCCSRVVQTGAGAACVRGGGAGSTGRLFWRLLCA